MSNSPSVCPTGESKHTLLTVKHFRQAQLVFKSHHIQTHTTCLLQAIKSRQLNLSCTSHQIQTCSTGSPKVRRFRHSQLVLQLPFEITLLILLMIWLILLSLNFDILHYVMVLVAFSLLARNLEECSTIHSSPVLLLESGD